MAGVIIDEEVTLRELHTSLKVEPSAWHTAGNALCKARSWLCTGGGFKMFQKGHGIFHICNDLCERWRFLIVACNFCLFTGRECSHGRFRKTEFVGMPCIWGKQHLFLHGYPCCFAAWKTPFRSSKGAIGRQSSAGLFSVKGPKLPAIRILSDQNPKKLEVRGAVSVISSTNFFTASPMGVRLKLSKHWNLWQFTWPECGEILVRIQANRGIPSLQLLLVEFFKIILVTSCHLFLLLLSGCFH